MSLTVLADVSTENHMGSYATQKEPLTIVLKRRDNEPVSAPNVIVETSFDKSGVFGSGEKISELPPKVPELPPARYNLHSSSGTNNIFSAVSAIN